jgi:hypothetical protein
MRAVNAHVDGMVLRRAGQGGAGEGAQGGEEPAGARLESRCFHGKGAARMGRAAAVYLNVTE